MCVALGERSMCVRYLLLCLLSVSTLFGQTTGSVVGRVTDPSKSAIPQAKVELTNENTGISAVASPTAEGDFIFARVEPGSYKLTVSSDGFNTVVKRNITILVNQTAR